MSPRGYALFDTALGRCGLAWGEAGLVGVSLPDPDERAMRARLARRAGVAADGAFAPPPSVGAAMASIAALFAGEPRDLMEIVIDEQRVGAFERAVYAATRAIPPGRTESYGEIARRIGAAGAAQAVGRALGANPWPIVVPCHRVTAADGALHGFSAPGGLETKRRLLVIEGALAPSLFD
ncbi:MAG: methylated-DNA--[protein]-cysteine S-methyltransferase [Rhizobiales bacterium]|nr:methylated-DNA--[protein]-cysteine S-methyltransferase [Hyphomicrobiales bacterium]